MRYFSSDRRLAVFSAIRTTWMHHAQTYTLLAIALLCIYTAFKFADEFPRLLWDQTGSSAWDLRVIQREVVDWFSGRSIYTESDTAVYPPASLVLFYPFLGWLPFGWARLLWGATTIGVLIWLIYLIAMHSGTQAPTEIALVSLLFIAMNATGVTIGVGETILHLVPFLIAGLFAMQRPASWRRDIVAAFCMIVALLKPSVSVPFLWMVLFSADGWPVLGLTILGYGALTLFAASFQSTPLVLILQEWLASSTSLATREGYANLSIWLASVGLGQWMLPASLLVGIALGIWLYRHRTSDLWLLLGVTSIAARLWTYNHITSDVLIFFPLVALYRIAKRRESVHGDDVVAGLLLAATMLMMLIPAQIYFLTPPWNFPYTVGHPIIWIIVLAFLIYYASHEMKSSRVPASPRLDEQKLHHAQ